MEFHSIGEFVSVVANVIFPLLLWFQWYRGHAKEQAVKNGIFASRRMVERMRDQGAVDVLDSLDAALATLNTRQPFKDAANERIKKIILSFGKESSKPLLNLPNAFRGQVIEDEVEQSSRRKKS